MLMAGLFGVPLYWAGDTLGTAVGEQAHRHWDAEFFH